MQQRLWTIMLLVWVLAGPATAQIQPSPVGAAPPGLEFDAGQRWSVDGAMMTHFRAMESDLVSFRGSSPEEYRELGARLEKQLALLMAGCTMQGKAHDELHEWLLPYMAEVNAFANDDDVATLKARQKALRSSFDVFNAYFR